VPGHSLPLAGDGGAGLRIVDVALRWTLPIHVSDADVPGCAGISGYVAAPQRRPQRTAERVDSVTLQGKAPTFGPPKTRASNRTIPLPQVVVDALAANLAAFPAEPDGLVFTLAGKSITRQAFRHKWRAAVKTAGLPTGTGVHALPHYYASLLIRHGESVKLY
jgi:integrase